MLSKFKRTLARIDASPTDRKLALVRSGEASLDTLRRLAVDPDAKVRRAVARSQQGDAATAVRLAHDKDVEVRREATRHPLLPVDELVRLLGKPLDEPEVTTRALFMLRQRMLIDAL